MAITINGSGTITGASTLATAISSPTLTTPTISGNANMTSGTKYQVGSVTTNALAWVKWTGSTGTISASYNVTSVTRSATGKYLITFTTALTDANYCVAAGAQASTSAGPVQISYYDTGAALSTPTTSSFYLSTMIYNAVSFVDPGIVTAVVFGN